jgi:hypothetical protein
MGLRLYPPCVLLFADLWSLPIEVKSPVSPKAEVENRLRLGCALPPGREAKGVPHLLTAESTGTMPVQGSKAGFFKTAVFPCNPP